MKRLLFAGLVLILTVSFSHAQKSVIAAEQKGPINKNTAIRNTMQKMSNLTGKMENLMKESTPQKIQDTADMMEKLSEDMKDTLKKIKKGSAQEVETRKMYEDMKDMSSKMKKGKATKKEMKAINDRMIKMHKKYL